VASILKNKPVWLQFYITVGALILLSLGGMYWYQYQQATNAADFNLIERGRSHFESIKLTRRWAAEHGAIYVFKKKGAESNPYLPDTDIETKDGKILLLHNPASITREISEYAEADADFSFRITSNIPINPNNSPDEWESVALDAFKAGASEFYNRKYHNGKTFYRYMAPLYVEESCLACHARQNYKIGEVRGGISISFNITDIEKALKRSFLHSASIFLTLFIFLVFTFFMVIRSFQKKILHTEQKIIEMANVDDLTGLYNRRYLMNRLKMDLERCQRYKRELGFIMLDLDYFKNINDQYGHLVGDEVLKSVAEVLQKNTRKNDYIARYGGEEIALVLPETELKTSINLAEKLCKLINQLEINVGDDVLKVSASFGVSNLNQDSNKDNMSADDILIKDADEALYRAKDRGRNQVCSTDNI
jgi:diguanylate cyclase (GGDEF)-like protein